MNHEVGTQLAALVDRLRERLGADATDDALDWIRHEEWYITVEVIADRLFAGGSRMDAQEWATFTRILSAIGSVPADYGFVAPRDTEGGRKMLDFALVEKELRSLVDESPIADQRTLTLIRESAAAGEAGIAFDTLCSWIVDGDLPVTPEYYVRLRDLSEVLGAEDLVRLMSSLVIT